ncbi:alpha/beta hydrolase [Streptomyces noursei]
MTIGPYAPGPERRRDERLVPPSAQRSSVPTSAGPERRRDQRLVRPSVQGSSVPMGAESALRSWAAPAGTPSAPLAEAEDFDPAPELSLEAGQPHDFAQADTANRRELAADLDRPAPGPAGPAEVSPEFSRCDAEAAGSTITDALQGGEADPLQSMSRFVGTSRKAAPEDLRRANAYHLIKALAAGSGLPCHVLSYEPEFEGVGRMAVALGDIETATHVCVLIPGMGSDPSNFDGLVRRARTVYDECGRVGPAAKVAVIAWQGYKAPRDFRKGKGEVGNDQPAKDGSRLLNIDLAHWRALWNNSTARKSSGLSRPPEITINGFSYGSTVAGYALMRRTEHGGITDGAKGAYVGFNRELLRQVLSLFPLTAIAKKRMQGGTWKQAATEGAKKAVPIVQAAGDPTLVSVAAYAYAPAKATVMRSVNQARAGYNSEPLGGGEADYLVLFGSPGTGRRAKHLNIPATRIYAAAHKHDLVSQLNYFSIDPTHVNYDPTGGVTRLKSEYTPAPDLGRIANWERAHTSYYDAASDTQPARESLTNLARIVTGNRHKVTAYKKRSGHIVEGHKNFIGRGFTSPATNTEPLQPDKQTEKEKQDTGRSRRKRNIVKNFGDITELDFDGWKMLVERSIDWDTPPHRGNTYQTIIEALVPGAGDIAGIARATSEADRIWYTARLLALPAALAFPHLGLILAVADFVKGKAEAFVSTLAEKEAARQKFQDDAAKQISQCLDHAHRLMWDMYMATLADEGKIALQGKRYQNEMLKIAVLAFQTADAQAAGSQKAWETHPSNQGLALDKSMLYLKYRRKKIKSDIDGMLDKFLGPQSGSGDLGWLKTTGRIMEESSVLANGAAAYLPAETGGCTFLHVTPAGQAHLVTMKKLFSKSQGVIIQEEKREWNKHLSKEFSDYSLAWSRSGASDEKGPRALACSDNGVLYALFRNELMLGGMEYILLAYDDYKRGSSRRVMLPTDFTLPRSMTIGIRGMYFDPIQEGILVIEYGDPGQYCQLDIGAYEKQRVVREAWQERRDSALNNWKKNKRKDRPRKADYLHSKVGAAPELSLNVTANKAGDTAANIHQRFSAELGGLFGTISRDKVIQSAFGDVIVGGSVDGKRWVGRYGEKKILLTDFGTKPATTYTPDLSKTSRYYILPKQMSFSVIAETVLGDEKRWEEIYDLNPKLFGTAEKGNARHASLPLGFLLRIPNESVSVSGPTSGNAQQAVSAPAPETSRDYILPEDMSFKGIAENELGDRRRWREIYDLNPLYFGTTKKKEAKDIAIPRGSRLRIPVK